MILYAVLGILIILLGAGAILSIRLKKFSVGSIGLIGTQVTSVVTLICVIIITNSKNIKLVGVAFNGLCISAVWFRLFFEILLSRLNTNKKYVLFKRVIFYLSLTATGLLLYNIVTADMFVVSRHIMFGSRWWVLVAKASVYNYIYAVVFVLCDICVFTRIICELAGSAVLYRTRMIILLITYTVLEAFTAIAFKLQLPIWILEIGGSIFAMSLVYWSLIYANAKLTKVSLMAFANNFSEGFILYDERDRMVYVNTVLRNAINDELLERFNKRANFDAWAEEVENIEGIPVKKIEINSKAIYARIYEHKIEDDKAYVGTFYNLVDTTDAILQIEAMERINEELEQTARMKSDFLANMSHEIRTPMNAVIGMAEMAMREQLPPQAFNYINQIKTSGHNLLNIINDILDFSKIEAGKMDIICDAYEPASEYQDVANTLMTRIKEKDIGLFVNVDPNLPNKLEGDSMRIRQVLINIANNAIKFTKQGQVCIDITFDRLAEDCINIIVHVKDTGMGIKEEDRKKLFVSFQQVDAKRNRSIEGTGLGLAISKSLVEAMNGTIGVESEYGVGSDFYFEIPQKVIDNTPSMTVENKDNIFILGIFKKKNVREQFEYNINALEIPYQIVEDNQQLDNIYAAVSLQNKDKKLFLIFEKNVYDENIAGFLEKNTQVEGVVLVAFDSLFTSDLPNLRVIRNPLTTLSLSLVLNNKTELVHSAGNVFSFDFIAPKARVLIVDDNDINIAVAQGLLEPLEMNVDAAMSGKEAIQKAISVDYDIIFMDHMMPEMDGIEATKHIREKLTRDVPIIALSANAVSGAKEMFLSNGMNDFVSKPIELKSIVSKIKQWLPKEKIVKDTGDGKKVEKNDVVDIPGLDCEHALKLIGSTKLYIKITKDYMGSIDKHYEEIQLCYQNEDWENYTVKVHALKSSSRQIGAMELAGMAERLEAAGHQSDIEYIRSNTDDMFVEYKKVKGILVDYFGETKEETQLKSFDAEYVSKLLKELKEGCEELDMDVMEKVSEELSQIAFDDSHDGLAKEIIDAISIMDMDTCVEKADRLLELI